MQQQLLVIGASSLLLLTGCQGLPKLDSSINTHNVCYEIRQQINTARISGNPNQTGNNTLQLVRLYKLYKKYHCADTEPAAVQQKEQSGR